jgi:hypothetical protein
MIYTYKLQKRQEQIFLAHKKYLGCKNMRFHAGKLAEILG